MSGCSKSQQQDEQQQQSGPGPSPEAVRLAGRIEAIRNGRRQRRRPAGIAVGSGLPEYYRRSVSGPARKVERLIEAWEAEVPPGLARLTALKGLSPRGVLTVRASSSATAYQLRRLMASGLSRSLSNRVGSVSIRSIRIVIDPGLNPTPNSD
ncbi:MAG: DUF721 domain-containing protein [Planctomycetes bacterium]|nr:DUF721 domain-containing protein [Planctomycetota bacterium]NOG55910.1 DUF721 domain-containing protein [Planctomycetota bacterium]